MVQRNPVLARLDVLVGRWTVQPEVDGLGAGWTEFTWVEDGKYLRQFTDAEPLPDTAPQAWRENNPLPSTQLIGLDDTAEAFSVLYADARGVHRIYQMTFADRAWRMWRDAPGFHQRWIATVGDDEIQGRWEKSTDGVDWTVDFGLTYRR
ncbi:hypothetical protein ONA70_24100 [Micromonospora yasonensis]|uniref:hypothetical protein n=1 Tax=Micromonospora yasonensis TaxID=1128667 RepID=UPI00222E5D48|nr:hypothetical protein [Micromonospora yasonensis]MCW3843188.1 hypothetical protein [Micromonospora yasonensis]